MADIDPTAATGLVGILGGAMTLATVWGSKLIMKRMGLDPTTASEANSAAQKDMLDWQREQLTAEVARRERAEVQSQAYLDKLNELTKQLNRLELQNQHSQEQMALMAAQNERLTEQVATLNNTVEQLRAAMADRVDML